MITLTIDGTEVTVEKGTTVLEAARKAHIHIPTLCFLKDLNEIGACRICVVDAGARNLQASCVLEAQNGMVVKTNTPKVREARKTILELILSNHDKKCLLRKKPKLRASKAFSGAWHRRWRSPRRRAYPLRCG